MGRNGGGYVPLQVLGWHSMLRGTFSPEELVRACVRLGIETCALTDRGSLGGAVAFVKAARKAGVRPLLGVDLEQGGRRLTLLARNRAGYAACCEVVTALQVRPECDLVAEVARRARSLVVLCADPDLLPGLHGALAGEREKSLYGAVVRLPGHRPERLRRVAEALGVPLVAAGDVHLLEPRDLVLHRVLRAIGKRSVVERLPEEVLVSEEARLLGPQEMARRHRGEEHLLAATREIAEACAFELELDRPIFPRTRVPEGRNACAWLRELTLAGAARRYGDPPPLRVRQRIERELAVIEELGFCDYFLIVREILDFARAKGIPFVGRGSAADSLVVHCLGFTRVDPLEHDLVFERFLSRSRRGLPDIDIDFCWRRRDEVIAWIYERFGRDRVATISTHCTLRFRSAFREAARALGVPPDLVNRASRALPHGHGGSLAEAVRTFPECRFIAEDERLLEALRVAEHLRGAPRHFGMHPGGMVIADRPITWYTPLCRSAKGPLITQMEMRAVEALGLVKMDILGQRSLSTIGDALELIRGEGGEAPELERLKDDDPDAARLLIQGRTLGCFQVESPGMRKLVVEMRARRRKDLIAAIALIRPGPAAAGMKERFVRRARGREEVRHLHPVLADVLGETHGVMLYQEDILRVAEAVAGFTLEEGDLVRGALGKKKDPELLAELSARYFRAARERGIAEETAREIWRLIGNFAAFAFCKAHAATYGYLAWEELHLKARHPAAFFCAVLNNHRGYYPDRVYLEEALRSGVRFLLPDVNRSGRLFKLERGCIRIGLGRVRNLSRRTLDRLFEERERGGPFFSLRDLMERVAPDVREARHLIQAGALDLFDRSRPELLWRLELLLKEENPTGGGGGLPFAERPPEPALPRLADWSEEKKRRLEYAVLGMTAAGGGAIFGRPERWPDTVAARDLARHVGRVVTCFGWCSATRRVRTSEGRYMRFITLEDPSGTIEGVFFPDACLRFAHVLQGEGPYLLRGKVEAENDALTIRVLDFRRAEPVGKESS